MAKSQKRSSRETRKPKAADKAKVKTPSYMAVSDVFSPNKPGAAAPKPKK